MLINEVSATVYKSKTTKSKKLIAKNYKFLKKTNVSSINSLPRVVRDHFRELNAAINANLSGFNRRID